MERSRPRLRRSAPILRYDARQSMGLFDYFEPEPPVGCARPGCAGALHGWQGKHQGNCQFIWQQGRIDPVDQSADEGSKLPPERLASIRLAPNEVIRSGYAHCDVCTGYAPFDIECVTDNQGLWIETRIDAKLAESKLIEDHWIQCMNCFDAWPHIPAKTVYRCPSCDHIVQR